MKEETRKEFIRLLDQIAFTANRLKEMLKEED